MKYTYTTRGVCSRSIFIDMDGEIIKKIEFDGGCNGNTKGLAKMVEGLNAKDVIKKLKGTTCGNKTTSCPDQLAIALEEVLAKQND